MTSKNCGLKGVPYARTELQLRHTWCFAKMISDEYGSFVRKHQTTKICFLLIALGELMINEGAAAACTTFTSTRGRLLEPTAASENTSGIGILEGRRNQKILQQKFQALEKI